MKDGLVSLKVIISSKKLSREDNKKIKIMNTTRNQSLPTVLLITLRNVHAFYEYFKSFQMKGNESKLSDTRKYYCIVFHKNNFFRELKKVTEGFKKVPERDAIQIWNLVPVIFVLAIS